MTETVPCDMPNLSAKSLSCKPNLRRTRVRKNSFIGFNALGGPLLSPGGKVRSRPTYCKLLKSYGSRELKSYKNLPC